MADALPLHPDRCEMLRPSHPDYWNGHNDRMVPRFPDGDVKAEHSVGTAPPDSTCRSQYAEHATGVITAYDLARDLLVYGSIVTPPNAQQVSGYKTDHWHGQYGSGQWHCLAEEAEYHGVAPLLSLAVARLPEQVRSIVADSARRTLQALALRHRRASQAREAVIDRLLTEFTSGGVRVLLLKGAALAHCLYAKPELRPMADIDILVDADDQMRAVAIAERIGFVFAPHHASSFAGNFHHLPPGTKQQSGYTITLEIHRDVLPPDQVGSITLRNLTVPLQTINRGQDRPQGLALGHIDMLRHLTRHAFEPVARVRLIHLHDLWQYQARFHDEIDWPHLQSRHPGVITALRLVHYVLPPLREPDGVLSAVPRPGPSGIGAGMLPLSKIAGAPVGPTTKLKMLFDPPAWWLHGYYGIPPEHSLRRCRLMLHPATVARWLARRLAAVARSRFMPSNLGDA